MVDDAELYCFDFIQGEDGGDIELIEFPNCMVASN